MISAIRKGAKKKLSDNFNSFEFDCKCTDPKCVFTLYSLEMIKNLEILRVLNGGQPLHVNRGYSCSAHNKAIGGAKYSQHLVGVGTDINCPIYLPFESFKKIVYKVPFKFIICHPDEDFIHVDLRTGDY